MPDLLLNYSMAKKQRAPRKNTGARLQNYFREWRKYRGMTLERAGELAGMTAGNLSAMERGAQGYSDPGLEALARVYRCTKGELLTVDPTKVGSIWPIWEKATASDRQKIVEIAKTIVGVSADSD